MALKNLEKMSYRELQDLELRVKKAMSTAQERDRGALRQKIEALASSAGFTAAELFNGRGRKGKPVAPKYANPDNPSETWTGRGRRPRWLAAKVDKSGNVDKFRIK